MGDAFSVPFILSCYKKLHFKTLYKPNSAKTTLYHGKTVQYVVLGPRKSAMALVRDFSENDKLIFRREKKYVE